MVLASMASTGSAGAQGRAWSLEASIGERLQYEDNVGLDQSGRVADSSSQTVVMLDLAGRTRVLELSAKTRLDFTYFLSESRLNSNDQHVTIDGTYRRPLSRWGLSIAYDRDTTRTTEEDDTGVFILANVRREAFGARPSWSYDLSRLDTVIVRGDFKTLGYEGRLVDYLRYGGEAEWARRLTTQSAFFLTGFGRKFEFDTARSEETEAYGLQAGLTFDVASRLQLRGAGGFLRTTTAPSHPAETEASGGASSLDLLPSAGLVFRIDRRTRLESTFTRSLAPSEIGNILKRDVLDATFVHQWNRKISWGLEFRFLTQKGLEPSPTRVRRSFVRGTPSVEAKLTEAWLLRGGYRFRWQAFDDQDDGAFSSAFFLTVTYQPLARALSP
jgi:hypothetical protein